MKALGSHASFPQLSTLAIVAFTSAAALSGTAGICGAPAPASARTAIEDSFVFAGLAGLAATISTSLSLKSFRTTLIRSNDNSTWIGVRIGCADRETLTARECPPKIKERNFAVQLAISPGPDRSAFAGVATFLITRRGSDCSSTATVAEIAVSIFGSASAPRACGTNGFLAKPNLGIDRGSLIR